MKRIYREQNVMDAFVDRMAFIFSNFDHIVVAFSGGKDSGLMLELMNRYPDDPGRWSRMAIVGDGVVRMARMALRMGALGNILIFNTTICVCRFPPPAACPCINPHGCRGIRRSAISGSSRCPRTLFR